MEPATDPPAGGEEGAERSASSLFRAVGLRVRELRQAHQLTLDELSERSGVSRRMITMLEAGEANASIGTLDKLARALDCDFYTMITGSPLAPLSPEVARSVAPLWEDDKGSSAKLLVSHRRASTTELWQWEMVGGSRYDAEPDPPGSEEMILVSSGHLVVEVADESYSLEPQGYLRVPTDRPYAYFNPARSTCRFVRIIVMP